VSTRRPPDPTQRIEPHLGDAPEATPQAVPPPRRASPQARSGGGWKIFLGLLAVIAIVAGAAALLGHGWPGTRLQSLLDDGNAALAQGRLDNPDGSGARQKFEAALALDGDRSEAREGLMRTGMAALLQARAATARNDVVLARQQLDLAVALQVPKPDSDAVDLELRQKESKGSGIEAILAKARQTREAGRRSGNEEAALPLYQRVLSLQPENTEALEAREDLLAGVLARARNKLQAGDLDLATTAIARVRRFDPGHVDLPQVQAEWERGVDALRARADTLLTAGDLANATETYQKVLRYRPEDAVTRSALQRVAEAHALRARRAAGDFQFADAEQELALAKAIAPDSAAVRQVELSLTQSRDSMARLGRAGGTPLGQQQRVVDLLAQMQEAAVKGQWIEPPGDSAYDRLRAAQAIAPDDPGVRQAAARVVPEVRRCFEDELSANRIARSRACLDAWQALARGDVLVRDARRRLAARWVAVGTERLGAGDVPFASRAVSEARGLDPAAAGLADFDARVRSAQATP
jgi:tetratricopeptide (TPR) repeat protein